MRVKEALIAKVRQSNERYQHMGKKLTERNTQLEVRYPTVTPPTPLLI